METLDILPRLIGFDTVSSRPNRDLIEWCGSLLDQAGAEVQIIRDKSGHKANLYATIGPKDRGGVMLSGHTDVVPVDGQAWTRPPFEATFENGRVYGRGTTDMKGFVASALSMAVRATEVELRTPLHLALSHDEEVGCIGVRSLIDMLANAPVRPRFCIVGEPTSMAVATGHKGKTAFEVTCTGKEAHSALAPTGLNALYLASDMIGVIRAAQTRVQGAGSRDPDHDVPFTTLHVGTMSGGTVLNIVPNHARFMAEIRNLPGDDPGDILNGLRQSAQNILAPMRDQFPGAAIDIRVTNTYPPLGTAPDAEVVRFVKSLSGANNTIKVAFGTEGGLFDANLGLPTVVCGPGSMAQGHKTDEFVALEQLERCDAMLGALLERLKTGI